MSATDRATRRATVRQLSDAGMSARAIAAKLGVGKDTVRRDLATLARATDTPPAPRGGVDFAVFQAVARERIQRGRRLDLVRAECAPHCLDNDACGELARRILSILNAPEV